jgi:type IV secretion system protein VirB9
MIRASILASALLLSLCPAQGQARVPARDTAPQSAGPREFGYLAGTVYPVLTAPGRLTDLVLEPGETLVEANAIAAGDTARWMIGETASGAGETRRVHVLVKPIAAGLSTNLLINTTRRSYHLELRSSDRAWLPQVSWRYRAIPAPLVAAPAAPVAAPAPTRLNFSYRVEGRANWRPTRVYDDGARTYVEFPPSIAMADLPPIYLTAADGKGVELVNYRVDGRRIIVDRLLARAQLRQGLRRLARRVTIERIAGQSQ